MRKRQFEIVAQDPSIRDRHGNVLTAHVSLPIEDLAPGPMGYAVYVVDFDASAGVMYEPTVGLPEEEVEAPAALPDLLADEAYHAFNVYAIVMRTLLRFEFALGRRVGWGIHGHQLKVVPHAFEEANAFYSPDLEALLFGYVRDRRATFLCLSHDVVAHETAHALLDGLRDKFMAPSSPDQAALHEAFADIVALLSVFSLPEIASHLLVRIDNESATPTGFVRRSSLSEERLKATALFGLAEEMRGGSTDVRVNALRRSVTIKPDPNILERSEFQEEHRRGEVLVAAVMRALLTAWLDRIHHPDGNQVDGFVELRRVAEEGADIADLMLTMAIRAVDYTPPIHISFGDFLSAMLTADSEVRADDSRYRIREHMLNAMAGFGIQPSAGTSDGCWQRSDITLVLDGSHLGSLQSDSTEMFRHIWNNRAALRLDESAFTRIASVRPCVRVSPDDGFQVRETVVECVQYLKVRAAELARYQLKRPSAMPPDADVVLEAGHTLILDEYGNLKFNISNRLPPPTTRKAKEMWNRRLQYLWEGGYFSGASRSSRLASFHLERALVDDEDLRLQPMWSARRASEGWT